MRSPRLLMDRLFRLVTPGLDSGFAPGPVPLGDGLWAVDRRIRLAGALCPCRSTIARVANGDLVVLGAPALASRCAAEIEALGRVATIVAPNSFHYVYAADALAAFPSARFVVAPGLPERVPALPPALELDALAVPPWSAGLEHVALGPARGVAEVLFYHVPSRTLVLTDLAFNVVRHERRIDGWIWRAYGIRPAFGTSRNSRMVLRIDRDASRRALRRALEWPFERIVVAHGDAIESDARQRFTDAFAAFL